MGIGDNLGLVGCAHGFRVPLPYRQHQQNTGARFRPATHFLTFMLSLATFWKHSSLEKTCRTNENVDNVDLNL